MAQRYFKRRSAPPDTAIPVGSAVRIEEQVCRLTPASGLPS